MQRTRLASLCLATVALLSSSAEAQGILPGRFSAGAYGGVSLPVRTYGEEANMGWNAGVMLELIGAYQAVDIRLDGMFTKFGEAELVEAGGTHRLSSEAFIYTLAAELNLGADSAAYPGDNTISPWIIAGPGIYRFDFEDACTGGPCGVLTEASVAETYWGINVGGGATIPFLGLRTFVEGRYHIAFSKDNRFADLTMVLLSAGIKFR